MKSRSNHIEIRRCRPLLGTFVEISAAGLAEEELNAAINAAFSSIETIHNLLSAHARDSELSLLNREAASRPVMVSRQTFAVVRRAVNLASESNGAFNPAIAPVLARWNFLPATLKRNAAGSWRDVRFLPGRKIRYLKPLALDLGGIAKGFAVDRAIETLRMRGARAALVNAGGDLRVFGQRSSTIHVRHPENPGMFAGRIPIRNAALATSSPYFTEKTWQRGRVSHLVDSRRQCAVTGAVSVSIRARECWLADALTKVVLNAPQLAPELLEKRRAKAFVYTT